MPIINNKIRVKIIARGQDSYPWAKQLPDASNSIGNCEYVFAKDDPVYDWLVVIDDVSRNYFSQPETLNCSREHTLLVTTEPPIITNYGDAFCSQFAKVLTSHPEHALSHPGKIFSHTGNLWFNGHNFDDCKKEVYWEKSRTISVVCSSKSQKHTLHNKRNQFCMWLNEKIPSLDTFGHGHNFVKNKFTAIDPYKFHVAIENYAGINHWTEKLSDSFLSGAYHFYFGCTNLDDFFDKRSYALIDLNNWELSLQKINEAISDEQFYKSRIDAIRSSKELILQKYNLLFMINEIVEYNHTSNARSVGGRIFGRKQMRVLNPSDGINHFAWYSKRILGNSEL